MKKHVIICAVFVTQFFCVQSANQGGQPIPFGAAFAVPILVPDDQVVPEEVKLVYRRAPGYAGRRSRRVPQVMGWRVKLRRLFQNGPDQVVPEGSEASEALKGRLQTPAERAARAKARLERRQARLNMPLRH